MWPFKKKARKREIAEVYLGLRNNVLSADPRQFGLTPTSPDAVWGVLMDTGDAEAVHTLLVVADRTVSLYFSNGGGMIGAGQHETVWQAAQTLLASAPRFVAQMEKATELPLPDVDRVRFSILTFDGFFTAEAPQEQLGNGELPLSPLFHQAHGVITQMFLVKDRQRSSFEALMRAATTGSVEEAADLLRSGADPNAGDETGLTPLMAAAYSGSAGVIPALLEAGANLEAKDSSGYTPLMFACNAGKLECVKILVEGGADIHAKDSTGSTPIMFAAQHGHKDILGLLLSKGADPHQKGDHGLSALELAQQNRHAEAIALLQGPR